MIRTQKKCSNCGFIIKGFYEAEQNPQGYFNKPFTMCPLCKHLLINGGKEYIMSKKPQSLFHIKASFNALWIGISIGLIVAGIIIGCFSLSDELAGILLLVFSIAGIIVFEIIGNIGVCKSYPKEKAESIKRTQNKEYLDLLLSSKLIKQEQYDDAIKTYGLSKRKIKVINTYDNKNKEAKEIINKAIKKREKEKEEKKYEEIEKNQKFRQCNQCGTYVKENAVSCPKCGSYMEL